MIFAFARAKALGLAVRLLLTVPVIALVALGAETAQESYNRLYRDKLVPLICEAIRFRTVAGDLRASADQQAWLGAVAKQLGLTMHATDFVSEIDLPGPEGAPVLGLVTHGDVVPVDAKKWTFPPFAGIVRDGFVLGRGASDDKGAMVQALLAMAALKASSAVRTHTIRLLVGTDEESAGLDMGQYLMKHRAPDYSLVLDLTFPVVVGEKAWNALTLTTKLQERAGSRSFPYRVVDLHAGLDPAIVPDEARIVLRSDDPAGSWAPLVRKLQAKRMPVGTTFHSVRSANELTISVAGKSAHGGANLEGGRNALVALARLMENELPKGGADDLLAFVRMAGQDLYGTWLGLPESYGSWGRYAVNVATIDRVSSPEGAYALVIVARRTPPLTGPQLKDSLEKAVATFNASTGSELTPSGDYADEPLVIDPDAKLVKRLLAAYTHATGQSLKPAISGASSYAKRLPNSVPFGMWFQGKPIPWHGVDEKVAVTELQLGERVLIEALTDLASGPALKDPLRP